MNLKNNPLLTTVFATTLSVVAAGPAAQAASARINNVVLGSVSETSLRVAVHGVGRRLFGDAIRAADGAEGSGVPVGALGQQTHG